MSMDQNRIDAIGRHLAQNAAPSAPASAEMRPVWLAFSPGELPGIATYNADVAQEMQRQHDQAGNGVRVTRVVPAGSPDDLAALRAQLAEVQAERDSERKLRAQDKTLFDTAVEAMKVAAEASAKDARRKALEEAAKQGEHIIDDWTIRDSDPTGLSRSAVRIFMTRIRALQGPTP